MREGGSKSREGGREGPGYRGCRGGGPLCWPRRFPGGPQPGSYFKVVDRAGISGLLVTQADGTERIAHSTCPSTLCVSRPPLTWKLVLEAAR